MTHTIHAYVAVRICYAVLWYSANSKPAFEESYGWTDCDIAEAECALSRRQRNAATCD
jgi:hypothetical protein